MRESGGASRWELSIPFLPPLRYIARSLSAAARRTSPMTDGGKGQVANSLAISTLIIRTYTVPFLSLLRSDNIGILVGCLHNWSKQTG